MTVVEYDDRFHTLGKYEPSTMTDERLKMLKFKIGLRSQIQSGIVIARHRKFDKMLEVCRPLMAEIQAALFGILHFLPSFRPLMIETDCELLVMRLRDMQRIHGNFHLHLLHSLLHWGGLDIAHTYREANMAAHSLTQQAMLHPETGSAFNCPYRYSYGQARYASYPIILLLCYTQYWHLHFVFLLHTLCLVDTFNGISGLLLLCLGTSLPSGLAIFSVSCLCSVEYRQTRYDFVSFKQLHTSICSLDFTHFCFLGMRLLPSR